MDIQKLRTEGLSIQFKIVSKILIAKQWINLKKFKTYFTFLISLKNFLLSGRGHDRRDLALGFANAVIT